MASRLKLAAQASALLLVAALLGLLAWKLTHQGEGGQLVAALADDEQPPAPDFTLPHLEGDGELELASLRGKAVVLNFWATWCDPCKKELPRLQDAWERHRDDGVVFIGVNTRDFEGDARRALRKYGTTYPNVYDGTGTVVERYGGLQLPRTFFIDREGRIVDYYFGELRDDDLRGRLSALLGNPA